MNNLVNDLTQVSDSSEQNAFECSTGILLCL